MDFKFIRFSINSRSVNRKITTLKSLFKFLLLEDIITETLLKRLSHLRILRSSVFLDESKMKDLFEEMNFPETFEGERKVNSRCFIWQELAIELINLNLSDIDFQKSILKVIGKRNKKE